MQRQQLCDGAAAQRKTDDVRLVDLQRVKDAHHVQRLLPAVSGGFARRVAFAVAARIKYDDAEVFRQVVDDAGGDPALQT